MMKCLTAAVLALMLTASSAYASTGWILLLTVHGYTDADITITTNFADQASCNAAATWMKNKIQGWDSNLTVHTDCNNP